MGFPLTRPAKYAGSWYEGGEQELLKSLETYEKDLGSVELLCGEEDLSPDVGRIRAIIGPHAAPQYSGRTASCVYKIINLKNVKRIFIFGPAHSSLHIGCLTPSFSEYNTPFGKLAVDEKVVCDLHALGNFVRSPPDIEISEHSLEMHLPFLYRALERCGNTKCKIVPIIVGQISDRHAKEYGSIFAKYVNESSLFVISSDFCHWGDRFSYYYIGKGLNANNTRGIWKYVRKLDLDAIKLIEKIDIEGLQGYMEDTDNTICGYYPILILLATLSVIKSPSTKLKFIAYDQSEKAEDINCSSVSYASAYVTM